MHACTFLGLAIDSRGHLQIMHACAVLVLMIMHELYQRYAWVLQCMLHGLNLYNLIQQVQMSLRPVYTLIKCLQPTLKKHHIELLIR